MVSEESVAEREDKMRREREEEEVEKEEEEEVDDDDEEEEQKGGESGETKVVRDIRRYYCEFCGICRSKKALIATHILYHHKDKMVQKKVSDEEKRRLQTTCSECGKSFSKPAHLKQHMQSHSLECEAFGSHIKNSKMRGGGELCLEWTSTRVGDLLRSSIKLCIDSRLFHAATSGRDGNCLGCLCSYEMSRPFACPIDGCHCCYRRKDHLTRHLLTHEGEIFVCPVENCGEKFNVQANMKRHVEDLHGDDTPLEQKKELHVCPEFGCGKVFKYASKLRKHEDSHVKLDSVEVICSEPGCGKFFSSSKCLKEHILFAHRYISCEVCGSKQLKKNIKRHMRTHGSSDGAANKIKCTEGNCQHTFSNKSNLMQHIRAVHLQQQAFACRVSGCGARFAYKHVREGHEKTHFRTCTHEDFVEADEHYLSKARGGRKRKVVTAEALLRKRVVSGDSVSVLDDGNRYLRWLLAGEED